MNRRKQTRLRTHTYTDAGMYFITMNTRWRQKLFGRIRGDRVELNPLGEIVHEEWVASAEIRDNISLDAFVVMPDHFHGLIRILRTVSSRPRQPVGSRLMPDSIGSIMGQFKSQCTRRIRRHQGEPTLRVWQRNYYDRIVRDEEELARIRRYIIENPRKAIYRQTGLEIDDRRRDGRATRRVAPTVRDD